MPFQISENVVIGVIFALVSLWALFKDQWFVTHSRKGQRLTKFFGPARALWILRILFLCGILFGILLALGFIQPVQWD